VWMPSPRFLFPRIYANYPVFWQPVFN
jgi:hypothetical protein